MDAWFHPAKVRGAEAMMIEVFLGLMLLLSFALSLLTLLNDEARGQVARAYAREFRPTVEDECPGMLGKPFWFACASEVRRLSPLQSQSPPAAPSTQPQ